MKELTLVAKALLHAFLDLAEDKRKLFRILDEYVILVLAQELSRRLAAETVELKLALLDPSPFLRVREEWVLQLV